MTSASDAGIDPQASIDPTARVHPTALIEAGVVIGARSSVWDNVHVRHGARLGHDTHVGEKSYLAYDVRLGDYVKLNAMVYICALVTIEDGVMIAAGTTFTNDTFPRAMNRELSGLETSAVTEETMATTVRQGVTIGAQAVIGPGLVLNRYAMVGMGAVVTREVPAHGLVLGNPARLVGYVCACGPRLASAEEYAAARAKTQWACHRCGRAYARTDDGFTLAHDPHAASALLAP